VSTVVLLSAAWFLPAAAIAIPEPLPVPRPPPSSTQVLAAHLAEALALPGTGASSFAIRVAQTTPPPARGERLTGFIADALEVALRGREPQLAERRPASEEVALAFEVDLRHARGRLEATGRRVAMPTTVWQRLASEKGQTAATGFAAVPLDLELRLLLALGPRKVRFAKLRLASIGAKSDPRLGRQPVLDLAVADLDGDRIAEVVLLTPDQVVVAHWAQGGLSEIVGERSLQGAPRALARARHPLGSLATVTRSDGRVVLVAATTERAAAVVVSLAGGRLLAEAEPVRAHGWPLYGTDVDTVLVTTWPQGTDVLGGPVWPAPFGGAPLASTGSIAPSYGVRVQPLEAAVTPSWSPWLVQALAPSGLALWSAGGEGPVQVEAAGYVSAMVDLDADGKPELLTTGAETTGGDLLTLWPDPGRGRAARHLWRARVADPVTAAVAGDLDQDGWEEILVATWRPGAAGLLVIAP
jgi:hypothetical protein